VTRAATKVTEKVDPLRLRSIDEHPQVRGATERLEELGRQRADAEAELRARQEEQERLEAEAGRRLEEGGKIPADLAKELAEARERIVQTVQVHRVLDAATERETRARSQLEKQVAAEVVEELRELQRRAVIALDEALSVAAERNEVVMSVQDAGSRLARRTFGSGSANSAGVGTGGSSMIITADPLPSLHWRELSLRTTPVQTETRLSVWRDFASKALGIKLDGKAGK